MRFATPLLLVALMGLSACATYQPSEAKCFALVASSDDPCEFERLVPIDALDG